MFEESCLPLSLHSLHSDYHSILLCTAPSVPRLLSVTRILSDGFELNWLPPREPNGRPVYEIGYGTDDTNFTTVDTGSGDTYYNLTGLQHNTTYYIRVVAVNYFPFVPLRGNESETVTGIVPGEDTHWRQLYFSKLCIVMCYTYMYMHILTITIYNCNIHCWKHRGSIMSLNA